MRKAYIFLFLGVWMVILPFLGFPYAFKDVLTALTGIGLISVSFLLYRELKSKGVKKENNFENFSENSFENKKEEI